MPQQDRQVVTWLSKLPEFDYDDIVEFSQYESEYSIHCLSPDVRVLILQLVHWYLDWRTTWVNFPDELTRVDLLARLNLEVMSQMACSEDIADIIAQLTTIATTQGEIRDNIAAQTTALEGKLDTLNTQVTAIKTALEALDPSLFNDLEEGVNGVIEILGGVAVGLS